MWAEVSPLSLSLPVICKNLILNITYSSKKIYSTTNLAGFEVGNVPGKSKCNCFYTKPFRPAPVLTNPTGTHFWDGSARGQIASFDLGGTCPQYETWKYVGSSTHAPSTVSPTTHAPVATLAPSTHAPTSLSPTSHSPIAAVVTNKPSTHAPSTVNPTSHAPVATTEPSTHAPTSLSPTSHSPTSLFPSSRAPVSLAPSSKSAKNTKGGSKSVGESPAAKTAKNSKKL